MLVKLTTAALRGKQWPQKQEWFNAWGPHIFSLLIFSDGFSVVLHFTRVNVTNGSMMWYLDPGPCICYTGSATPPGCTNTSIHARGFAVSPHTRDTSIDGQLLQRAGQGRQSFLTHQQDRCLPSAKRNRMSTALALHSDRPWATKYYNIRYISQLGKIKLYSLPY